MKVTRKCKDYRTRIYSCVDDGKADVSAFPDVAVAEAAGY